MINSIAELEGRSDHLAGRAQAFRDRLHHALSNALASHHHQPALATERAYLLTATAFGIWLTAREALHRRVHGLMGGTGCACGVGLS